MASKYNPVNWFEIPVKDMKRAKSFYEKVFGWELSLNKVGSSEMAWFPMNGMVIRWSSPFQLKSSWGLMIGSAAARETSE